MKRISITKEHMSQGTCWGTVASVELTGNVSLVLILHTGDRARVSTQARHYFSMYIIITDQHQYLM